MSESSMLKAVKNCLIRRPKVRIALGLVSNNFIYLLSHTTLCAGCFGNDFTLEAYCRDSFARLAPKQGSCASTYKLSTGEVRNAPRQSLIPWLCMGSPDLVHQLTPYTYTEKNRQMNRHTYKETDKHQTWSISLRHIHTHRNIGR